MPTIGFAKIQAIPAHFAEKVLTLINCACRMLRRYVLIDYFISVFFNYSHPALIPSGK